MLGSIDGTHWSWKNYPCAWEGLYKGHIRECSVVLEAVADHDLWILQTFSDTTGSHNDFIMLQRSSMFVRLVEGHALAAIYEINGHRYTKG